MSLGRVLLIIFRWGIFLLACLFLYTRFTGPKGIATSDAWDKLQEGSGQWPMLWAIFLLMLLNWGIESHKWRLLMASVERVPPGRAFKATIAGTSVGLVSVNRTGDMIGRVLFLAPENRIRGGFSTAMGSIAQFVVTLMAGGVGLILLLVLDLPLPWAAGWMSRVLVTLTTLSTIAALTLYLYPTLLRQLLLHLPILRRLERASDVLEKHSERELWTVLLLSAARYVVFVSQFIWLLHGFGANISVVAAGVGVTVIYLIATLVPTVMLTELGVRGSVAVAILGPMGIADPVIVLAVTCLWTINVALPACVGSVILLMARIKTRNREE